jgi:hypothetical protein
VNVFSRVAPDASVDYELNHIASATPGQRAIYLATLFIREVDNGGLAQFFSNSSGMYTEELLNGLRLLGANQHASVVEQASRIFPEGKVPIDREERANFMRTIPKGKLKQVLEPFEEELFGEERLWPFFRKYIELHPQEFFVE